MYFVTQILYNKYIVLYTIIQMQENQNFIKILKTHTGINHKFLDDFFKKFKPIEFNKFTEDEFTVSDIRAGVG